MAKNMSLVWLILIGLTVTYVMADTFGKSPGDGKGVWDDVVNGDTLPLGKSPADGKGVRDDVVNGGTLGKSPADGKGVWDKVVNGDTLRMAYDIGEELYTLHSRLSPEHEKLKKGEISEEEFKWQVGKAVFKSGCKMGGKALGASIGESAGGKFGKWVGSLVGGKFGAKVCDFITEESYPVIAFLE